VDGESNSVMDSPAASAKVDRMARVEMLSNEAASPEMRAELERIEGAHGLVTNMKRTLARSPLALSALMTWYPLRDAVVAFLGARATNLFVHAISTRTDCLICSTFFRRILIEAGEDPDRLDLDQEERAIVDYARQLVDDANRVSDALYAEIAAFLEPDQIVTLTVFGGIMIATNVFNNALGIDLDAYLLPYRKGEKR
jgi:alkylhydroperoxidase family enzyme